MKVCKVEDCNNRVWSHGFCMLHTPKKSLRSIRSPRMNDNKKNVVDIQQMISFFLELWKRKQHYCENCGAWLGNTPHTYMFDHILEKQHYPELKYEEDNIMLLCLSCHDKKSRRFITEKIKERIEEVKTKFNL